MAIDQLIYTSCRTGVNGSGSGFQIYSYSEGFTDEELYVVESKICAYKEPGGLPSSPDRSAIKELFPVSFKYMKLNNHSTCLCKSEYIGRDYTGENGRFGNFISHAAAIGTDEISFYPALLHDSEFFLSSLPDGAADSSEAPNILPQWDVSELMDISPYNINGIVSFIRAQENGVQKLEKLTASVIKAYESGMKVLICDNNKNVPLWIAAVTMVFPICCAKNIFFSSYCYDPDDTDALICGVVPDGTAYIKSRAMLNGAYFIFDFINEDLPDIDTEDSRFVDFAANSFLTSFEELDRFHSFLESISFERPDEKIFSAFSLYLCVTGNADRLSEAEISDGLSYAENPDVLKFLFAPKKALSDFNSEISEFTRLTSKSIPELFIKFLTKNNMSIEDYCEKYRYNDWNKQITALADLEADQFAQACSSLFDGCQKDYRFAMSIYVFIYNQVRNNSDYSSLLFDVFNSYMFSLKDTLNEADYETAIFMLVNLLLELDADITAMKKFISGYETNCMKISSSQMYLDCLDKIYNYKKSNGINQIPDRTVLYQFMNKMNRDIPIESLYNEFGTLPLADLPEEEMLSFVKPIIRMQLLTFPDTSFTTVLDMLSYVKEDTLYPIYCDSVLTRYKKTHFPEILLYFFYELHTRTIDDNISDMCDDMITEVLSKTANRHITALQRLAVQVFPDEFTVFWTRLINKTGDKKDTSLLNKIKNIFNIKN